MSYLKSSLSKVSVVAVVLGLVACGHSNQQSAQAQAPQNPAEQQPSTSEQYGSAMGQQPGATGNEMGQGTQTPSTGAQPGMTGEQGGAYGQTGGAYGQQNGAYGQQGASGQGAAGSEYGGQAGGAMGQPGAQPGEAGQGAMGGMNQGGMNQGAMGQGGMGPAGGSMDVSSLNDNQLAAVVQAINKGEVQQAQLAESKARSPEVKRFAQQMANAHRQIESHQNQLFSRLQITPSDNTVSQQLKSDGQTHLSNLQGMQGKDFDQAYIADQIREHNNALELLDRALPNVKNPELKSDLQNVRSKIAGHLADAERIQQTLQKGSTNKQGGSDQDINNPGQDQQPNDQSNPNQNQHH